MPRKSFHQYCIENYPNYARYCDIYAFSTEQEAKGYVVFDGLPHPRQTPEQMRGMIKLDLMWKLINYFSTWRRVGHRMGGSVPVDFSRSLTLEEFLKEDLGIPEERWSERPEEANFAHSHSQSRFWEFETVIKDSMQTDEPICFNIELSEKYFEKLFLFGLWPRLEELEPLLKSERPEAEKIAFMRDYGVGMRVRNLATIPEDLGKWYQKAEKTLGLPAERLKDLFDQVNASGLSIYYSDQLPTLLRKRMDLFRFIEVMPPLLESGLDKRVEELSLVLDSDLPLAEKKRFLSLVAKEPKYLKVLPVDTTDFDDWYRRADARAHRYVNEEFGLEREYSLDVNLRVIEIMDNPDIAPLMGELLRMEERGEYNLARFTPGKIYARKKVAVVKREINFVEAAQYLISGLIGNNPERIERAKFIYDPETLMIARGYITTHGECPTKMFYSHIEPLLKILWGDFQPEHKIEAAEDVIKNIREIYLSNKKYHPAKFQLLNLVRALEGISQGEPFEELVAKMQDYTLMDLFGGSRLMCCAFLSEDREAKEFESILYQADPYIALTHLVPYQMSVPCGDPVGVTIIANCEDPKGRQVLLVDSAEGGRTLQNVPSSLYLPVFLRGIMGAAEESHSDLIFVPAYAVNGTAKKFRDYFKQVIGAGEPHKLHLTKIPSGNGMSFPKAERFLEAFRDRSRLSEEIPGYFLSPAGLREAHYNYEGMILGR
jgi:hypothetical protein